MKALWGRIAPDIPEDWRICGENLWAKHSIHYTNLKSYFYGFSIWHKDNNCLDWDTTTLYFEYLDIVPVPVLYDDIWDEQLIRNIDISDKEGYVVRVADEFEYKDFGTCVAKYVRDSHVQTDEHWRQQEFVPNGLINE